MRDWLECRQCGITFYSKELLLKHMEFSASDDRCSGHTASTNCGVCGEAFVSGENLRAHEARHHNGHHSSKPLVDQQVHSRLNHDTAPRDPRLLSARQRRRRSIGSNIGSGSNSDSKSGISNSESGISNSESGSGSGSGERTEPSGAELLQQIVQHMRQTSMEVIVLVEGIECGTSMTVQLTHSFSVTHGDVTPNRTFEPCVFERQGRCEVDFEAFHRTREVAPGEAWGPVLSHS